MLNRHDIYKYIIRLSAGETEQHFNKLMNGHQCDYTRKPDLPVGRQLRSPGHAQTDLKNLTITIIHHNESWSRAKRLARERFLDTEAKDSFPRRHK